MLKLCSKSLDLWQFSVTTVTTVTITTVTIFGNKSNFMESMFHERNKYDYWLFSKYKHHNCSHL